MGYIADHLYIHMYIYVYTHTHTRICVYLYDSVHHIVLHPVPEKVSSENSTTPSTTPFQLRPTYNNVLEHMCLHGKVQHDSNTGQRPPVFLDVRTSMLATQSPMRFQHRPTRGGTFLYRKHAFTTNVQHNSNADPCQQIFSEPFHLGSQLGKQMQFL